MTGTAARRTPRHELAARSARGHRGGAGPRSGGARHTRGAAHLPPAFHALMVQRITHEAALLGVPLLPRLIAHIARFLTGIEIHPGATIGRRCFIDHGMGVVIGETTIIGDNCHLYQGVTLGGTSTRREKRHPTLEDGVVVGAGAKIIGDVTIGHDSRIGAGAVVVSSVPPNATVVGVPGPRRRLHQPEQRHRRAPPGPRVGPHRGAGAADRPPRAGAPTHRDALGLRELARRLRRRVARAVARDAIAGRTAAAAARATERPRCASPTHLHAVRPLRPARP